MKEYTVYLYRTRRTIRGWLSYLQYHGEYNPCTITVQLIAENGAKAKNKAITLANKGFDGLKIVKVNFSNGIFALNRSPDIKKVLLKKEQENV